MKRMLLLAALTASPAAAEVKSSSPAGFEVERKAVVRASPAAIYAQIGRIGEWWDPAHSYSGKPANLRLDLKAGGCFCESFGEGGTIEHMRVVYADPKTGIRLSGALGPLQTEAVVGTLVWSFKAVEGGTELTELTQNYLVSGTIRAGMQTFAPPVDMVLSQQFERLTTRLGK
jgi:hypothetical protein